MCYWSIDAGAWTGLSNRKFRYTNNDFCKMQHFKVCFIYLFISFLKWEIETLFEKLFSVENTIYTPSHIFLRTDAECHNIYFSKPSMFITNIIMRILWTEILPISINVSEWYCESIVKIFQCVVEIIFDFLYSVCTTTRCISYKSLAIVRGVLLYCISCQWLFSRYIP
jgi:hypothetical protein